MKKQLISLMLVTVLCLALIGTAGAGDCAPIAESFELETYRGCSFGGRLMALDPDGDALSFELTTEPRKGQLTLDPDGSFVYTPADGKRGRDYFGYRAVDCDGNKSQEATVIIRLVKCSSAVSYTDLKGSACEYAAMRLAESGAFVGKCIGGRYYFEPEQQVSRGEFLSLCLEITGADLLSGVISTGFDNDSDIPEFMKPCVSTAVMQGIISGTVSGDGKVFDADEPVSRAEAMVMLDRTLRLSDVSYISVPDSVPAWAAQSAANLSANRLVDSLSGTDAALSRAECADMLVGAMDMLNR